MFLIHYDYARMTYMLEFKKKKSKVEEKLKSQ
jgi:hypothetical protein